MKMYRKSKNILVTGGTGYIGSHVAVELINKKYNPIIIDNLSKSDKSCLKQIKRITGIEPIFYEGDVRDDQVLKNIFKSYNIDCVIHFAGLKSISESYKNPNEYYDNNVNGSKNLINISLSNNVKKFIFSSSATVYGNPINLPIDEKHPLGPINEYGKNKLEVELFLKSICKKNKKINVFVLRYFNPVGSHESGLIGENFIDTPTNIMPLICLVANKKISVVNVYGDEYATPDGTGIRDYIHVNDLALGHIAALENKKKLPENFNTINLGTGTGFSVLELIKKFEEVNNVKVNYKISDKRKGDAAAVFADVRYSKEILNWSAKKSLADMVRDSWSWELNRHE